MAYRHGVEPDHDYNMRPQDPPRTAIPWQTTKKCYTEANVSHVLDTAPLKDNSEYKDTYRLK